MHRMPLARSLGNNNFHTAVLWALPGESGTVEVSHADQMIGFDAPALIRVLLVDAHLICGVY